MLYKLEHPTERLVRELVEKYYIFEITLLFVIVMLTSWIKSFPSVSNYCTRNFESFPAFSRFLCDDESSVTDSQYSVSSCNSSLATLSNHEYHLSPMMPEDYPAYETEIEPDPIQHTFIEEKDLPKSSTWLCTRSGRRYARR